MIFIIILAELNPVLTFFRVKSAILLAFFRANLEKCASETDMLLWLISVVFMMETGYRCKPVQRISGEKFRMLVFQPGF